MSDDSRESLMMSMLITGKNGELNMIVYNIPVFNFPETCSMLNIQRQQKPGLWLLYNGTQTILFPSGLKPFFLPCYSFINSIENIINIEIHCKILI